MIKLKSFTFNSKNVEKVDFTFSREGNSDLVLTLREKSDWPLIWGATLGQVEKWFFSAYGALFDFPIYAHKIGIDLGK